MIVNIIHLTVDVNRNLRPKKEYYINVNTYNALLPI